MANTLSYGKAKAVAPRTALAMGLNPDSVRPMEYMRAVNSGAVQPMAGPALARANILNSPGGSQSASGRKDQNPQQQFQTQTALRGGLNPQVDSRADQRMVNSLMPQNAQVQPQGSGALDNALRTGLAGLGFLSLFNR